MTVINIMLIVKFEGKEGGKETRDCRNSCKLYGPGFESSCDKKKKESKRQSTHSRFVQTSDKR